MGRSGEGNSNSAMRATLAVLVPLVVATVVMITLVDDNGKSVDDLAFAWPAVALLALLLAIRAPGRAAGRPLKRAIAEMTEVANAAADGDLTREPEINLNGAGGEMQAALADALVAFRGTISRIDAASTDLKQAGLEMAHTADEAGRAVTEVALAISSISEGSAHQVSLVGQASVSVSDIELALGDASEFAHEAQDHSAETRKLSEEGLQRAAEVREAMQDVRETALATADAVRALGAKTNDVDQIVQAITDIAAQTNMLALNAAIEAARAGEEGRGFANVADEVRQLADDAQHSAEKIAVLVRDIQAQTEEAVGAMEAGIAHVELGVETINRNRRTFTDISGAVDTLHESSTEIAELAAGTASGIAGLREQIEGVSEVAKRSSVSTEQVAASTDRTSSAAAAVSTAAQGVAATATLLSDLAARFKLPATAR